MTAVLRWSALAGAGSRLHAVSQWLQGGVAASLAGSLVASSSRRSNR
jgi:hypothetical protein